MSASNGAGGSWPQVSVVLISHDGASWLTPVLAGIAAQSAPIASIVAVDTGSRDGSAELIEGELMKGSVPAAVLRDAETLAVEVHGQHDDRGLLSPKGHRALLDAFGKLDTRTVESAWAEVTRIEAELAEARAGAALLQLC